MAHLMGMLPGEPCFKNTITASAILPGEAPVQTQICLHIPGEACIQIRTHLVMPLARGPAHRKHDRLDLRAVPHAKAEPLACIATAHNVNWER